MIPDVKQSATIDNTVAKNYTNAETCLQLQLAAKEASKMKALWTLALVAAMSLLNTSPAMAAGSGRHSAQGVHHSAQASAHGTVASAKLTSAVVATPLLAGAAVGELSGKAGNRLMEEADSDIGAPLPLGEETFTVGPAPDKAIY